MAKSRVTKSTDPCAISDRDTLYDIGIGDRVRRFQGRPENIGREGRIVAMTPTTIGGGDVGIRIREDSGTEFTCYTRQVRKV